MAVRQIDCYGFETTSEYFKLKKLDAHLVKIKDGVMYMCFGDEPQRPIHRLDKAVTKIDLSTTVVLRIVVPPLVKGTKVGSATNFSRVRELLYVCQTFDLCAVICGSGLTSRRTAFSATLRVIISRHWSARESRAVR